MRTRSRDSSATVRALISSLALALAIGMSGCDFSQRRERANEDAVRVGLIILRDLGVRSAVHVHVYSGTDGQRLDVSVQLLAAPKASAPEIKKRVNDIVKHTFRDEVTSVQISL